MSNNSFYERFGLAMKEARQFKNWTQFDLAREAKISRAAVASIESGRQTLEFQLLLRLCSVLNLPVKTFIEGEHQCQPKKTKRAS